MTLVEQKRSAQIFACPVPRWKRAFDLAGASLVILIASPLMILTALYIKLISPGKVFFTQQRIGHGGRPFTIIKFRTMRPGANVSTHKEYMAELIRNGDAADHPMLKLDGDNPEIIPLGNVLRKAAIDELPQLFNVIRGEMSLVGPRPVIPYEVREFLDWHHGRFDVLPGLTGLWQVMGKNHLTFNEMIRLDVRYSREYSPLLDARILLRTPAVILGQVAEGISNRRDGAQPVRQG